MIKFKVTRNKSNLGYNIEIIVKSDEYINYLQLDLTKDCTSDFEEIRNGTYYNINGEEYQYEKDEGLTLFLYKDCINRSYFTIKKHDDILRFINAVLEKKIELQLTK